MKIAIVHDWMTGMGEREQVLMAFAELFPDAGFYTLMYHPASMDASFRDRRVTSSPLQGLHWGRTQHGKFLPLYWGLMRGFDLSDHDLVVSSSFGIAKWVKVPPKTLHLCYCHEPMKWIWDPPDPSLGFPGAGLFRPYLRRCDRRSNEGVTRFLVPDERVQGQVKAFYGLDAEVFPTPKEMGKAKFLFKMQVYFRRLYGIKPIGED